MTVGELLEYVDEIAENPFSTRIKLKWLNQVEADIQVQVLRLSPSGLVKYTEEDMDAELLVPDAFGELYHWYLIRQIALAQEEFERANNMAATYNKSYVEYVTYICDTINPGLGCAVKMEYYLTAYQIAVKHGYSGSEADWVKSLRGPQGEPGAGLQIRELLTSTDELPENAEAGEAYLIGTQDANELHVWTGSAWRNCGSLRGERGPQGEQGVPGERGPEGPEGPGPGLPDIDESGYLVWSEGTGGGAAGTGIAKIEQTKTSTDSGGENIWTATLTDGTTSELVVRNGERGSDGANGQDGARGADGNGILTLTQTASSDLSGGENIWTAVMTDGSMAQLVVKNGERGEQGPQGEPGPAGPAAGEAETVTCTAGFAGKNTADLGAMHNGGSVTITRCGKIARVELQVDITTWTYGQTLRTNFAEETSDAEFLGELARIKNARIMLYRDSNLVHHGGALLSDGILTIGGEAWAGGKATVSGSDTVIVNE